MRNVFDQYRHPENQLTHSLVCALHSDPALLGPFLREVIGVTTPIPKHLEVTEQALPGEFPGGDEDEGRRGLPDACIFGDGDDWVVAIECKVSSALTRDQLDRHVATLRRRGFEGIVLVTLTVDPPTIRLPAGTVAIRWSQVYAWLRTRAASQWAQRTADYMEICEARWPSDGYLREGTLTEFSGYRFDGDHPYNYPEAKRIQALAMRELRAHQPLAARLGADLESQGRAAITGRHGDAVWDFIPIASGRSADSFTQYPHLTHNLGRLGVGAMITFPNSMRGDAKRRLKDLGEDGFLDVVLEVERNLRPVLRRIEGARPLFRSIQRHYKSQRSTPTVDALLEFDLRTALPVGDPRSVGEVKRQGQWIAAAYDAFVNSRSNYQIQIGANFAFAGAGARLAKPDAWKLMADVWLAAKPMLDAAVG